MIYAVIMAGGSGTRLWPRSREARPKQLISLSGVDTMLQRSVRRLTPFVDTRRIMVVGWETHESETRRQLEQFPGIRILSEPVGRDTAACIGLAAIILQREDPDAVMAALPADHFVEPPERFCAALAQAEEIARRRRAGGSLVTFGVKPRFACTQYGYIERGGALERQSPGVFPAYHVAAYREKPDAATAEEFLRQGRFYWNSGTFTWSVKDILDAIREFMPSLYAGLLRIQSALGTSDERAVRAEEYERLARISIDYGVMEKSKNAVVLEVDYDWDDLGTWEAVTRFQQADSQGNSILGTSCLVNSRNCIVVSEEDHLIGVVGADDLVIVHSPDATLVCRRDQLGEVKELVRQLREKGHRKHL